MGSNIMGFLPCFQAYCFYGKQLLEEEKCGESIRTLRHAKLR